MNTSPTGLDFIRKYELLVLHIYENPPHDPPTIGYGHVLRLGELFPCESPFYPWESAEWTAHARSGCPGIDVDRAEVLLARDVNWAEQAVNSCIAAEYLTQARFDALVSFTFNEGANGLLTSTVRLRLNCGDVQGAADAFVMWDKQSDGHGGLVVSDGLLDRRKAETAVFLSG